MRRRIERNAGRIQKSQYSKNSSFQSYTSLMEFRNRPRRVFPTLKAIAKLALSLNEKQKGHS